MKAIRIFLLILIIVGLGLIATQSLWVPKLVDKILKYQDETSQISTTTTTREATQNQQSQVVIPRAQAVNAVYQFFKDHPPANSNSLYCNDETAAKDARYYYFLCSALVPDGHHVTIGKYAVDKYTGAIQPPSASAPQ